MPTKRNINQNFGTYFITFTCYNWLPLIEASKAYDLVYNWFEILEKEGHYINAFVIMPNHVHVLITFTEKEKSINTVIGNGKRFIAYDIIKRLKETGQIELLNKLKSNIEIKRAEKGKKHNVWQLSFDWKMCKTLQFMEQKVNYIHSNPCSKKWTLCARPADYEHSSARQYLTDEASNYRITPYGYMVNIKLTKNTF